MDQNLEQRVIELEKAIEKLLSEYNRNNGPSSQIVTKNTKFVGGLDLSQLTNISIGNSSSTVGLFGSTPTTQYPAITAPITPSGTYVQAEAESVVIAVNGLRTALQQIGIIE